MAKSERLEVRLDADLLARLDAARGRESRASFVRWALEQALGGSSTGEQPPVSGGFSQVAGSTPARSASARASVPEEDVVEYEPRAVVRVDGAGLPGGPVFVPREPETFRVTQEGLRRSAGHHPACKCPVCRPSVGAS